MVKSKIQAERCFWKVVKIYWPSKNGASISMLHIHFAKSQKTGLLNGFFISTSMKGMFEGNDHCAARAICFNSIRCLRQIHLVLEQSCFNIYARSLFEHCLCYTYQNLSF